MDNNTIMRDTVDAFLKTLRDLNEKYKKEDKSINYDINHINVEATLALGDLIKKALELKNFPSDYLNEDPGILLEDVKRGGIFK